MDRRTDTATDGKASAETGAETGDSPDDAPDNAMTPGRYAHGVMYAWWALLCAGGLVALVAEGEMPFRGLAPNLIILPFLASGLLAALAARNALAIFGTAGRWDVPRFDEHTDEHSDPGFDPPGRPADRRGWLAVTGMVVGVLLTVAGLMTALGTIGGALDSPTTFGRGTWVFMLILGSVVYVPALAVAALGYALFRRSAGHASRESGGEARTDETDETVQEAAQTAEETDEARGEATDETHEQPPRMRLRGAAELTGSHVALALLLGSWPLIASFVAVSAFAAGHFGVNPLTFLVLPPLTVSVLLCASATLGIVTRED